MVPACTTVPRPMNGQCEMKRIGFRNFASSFLRLSSIGVSRRAARGSPVARSSARSNSLWRSASMISPRKVAIRRDQSASPPRSSLAPIGLLLTQEKHVGHQLPHPRTSVYTNTNAETTLPIGNQGEVKVKVRPAKGSATSLGATGSLLPVRLPPPRSALADKPPVAPRLRKARRQPVPTDFDFALTGNHRELRRAPWRGRLAESRGGDHGEPATCDGVGAARDGPAGRGDPSWHGGGWRRSS